MNLASLSTMNGRIDAGLPHVIFSFGTAPEVNHNWLCCRWSDRSNSKNGTPSRSNPLVQHRKAQIGSRARNATAANLEESMPSLPAFSVAQSASQTMYSMPLFIVLAPCSPLTHTNKDVAHGAVFPNRAQPSACFLSRCNHPWIFWIDSYSDFRSPLFNMRNINSWKQSFAFCLRHLSKLYTNALQFAESFFFGNAGIGNAVQMVL